MTRLLSGLQRLTAGAVAIAIGACSPEPIRTPGTAGAGLRVVITAVAADSIGYSVAARAVNADTATLEYGACASSVEVQRNGDWINLTPGGQCILIGYGVFRGLMGHVEKQDPGVLLDPDVESRMIWRKMT